MMEARFQHVDGIRLLDCAVNKHDGAVATQLQVSSISTAAIPESMS
jgi:hypothetical protein